MAVKGLALTSNNLNREIAKIKGRTREGLLAAALFVEGEAVPITPHSGEQGGTLRNSAFAMVTPPGVQPIVATVGYTAPYAPYVHEMPASFNFTSPGTGPKFLQRPLTQNIAEILHEIRIRANIPGGGRA